MHIPCGIDAPHSSSSSSLAKVFSTPFWMATLMGLKATLQQQRLAKRGTDSHKNVDIVDLCICLVSVVGSFVIIVPYCLTRRSRKLRHALILGLATSDLVSSLIIISTSAYSLGGGDLSDASRFCTFAGFAFAVALWTQHLWNLSIAIITYMILVHPLSTFVSSVEKHLIWLWPIFWVISLLVNGIAWIFVGFGNVGGYCSFDTRRGGLYFTAIFQFVPRAFVVLVVLVLYTHLFFFLRRVDMFNRATSSGGRQLNSDAQNADSSFINQVQSQRGDGEPTREDNRAPLQSEGQSASYWQKEEDSLSKGTWSELWLRWKGALSHSSSSNGQLDGSLRTGSASTQGKPSVGGPKAGDLPPIEMVSYSEVSPKAQPSEVTSGTPPYPSPLSTPAAVPRAPAMMQRPSTALTNGSLRNTVLIPRPSTGNRMPSYVTQNREDSGREGSLADWGDEDDSSSPFQPMNPRRDVRDFEMTSPPQEHLKHYSLSPIGVDLLKRNQSEAGEAAEKGLMEGGEEGEGSGRLRSSTEDPSYESTLGQNWTWGMAVGGAKGQHQQQQSQQPVSPTTPTRRRYVPWLTSSSSKRDRYGVGSGSSSSEENGVESLGSTLNRQASILLLLYPFVYCCLFSITIIRIIVDLAEQKASMAERLARNGDALHSISRWAIFAQGAIDAVIFQLVERSFRNRLKRRRRIAAGETVKDAWWLRVLTRIVRIGRH